MDRNVASTQAQKSDQERSGALISNAKIIKEIKEEFQGRWQTMIEDTNLTLSKLIGDSIIISSILAFDGDLSAEKSNSLLSKIMSLLDENSIKYSKNLQLYEFLYGNNFKDKAILSKLPDDNNILNKVAMAS